MCHSCWLTPLVRLKLYFWEWFTGPAEKSGAKPFHWDLLTLGSNAGGSQFQHRMDFPPFLSDKWSAYVRWEIEKMRNLQALGAIWKLWMQAEDAGKVLQFLYLLPSHGMGALREVWSVWKRCSTKAPPCSQEFGFGNTEHPGQHEGVCWHRTHFIHHLVINSSHTSMVGTLHLLSFCPVFIFCVINRIWVWVSAQQTLSRSLIVCQTAPFGSCWYQPNDSFGVSDRHLMVFTVKYHMQIS